MTKTEGKTARAAVKDILLLRRRFGPCCDLNEVPCPDVWATG